MTRHRPRPPSLLLDPLVLGAVALMVVNDRWLKPWFHDEVTGKLSDLAICAFLPAFFAEITLLVAPRCSPRGVLGAAAIAAAALFAGLELSPALAGAACALLGVLGPPVGIEGPFVMTRDLTDLLALPMVWLAYLHGRRRLGRPSRGEATHAPA